MLIDEIEIEQIVRENKEHIEYKGDKGDTGIGIAKAGKINQVLSKLSNNDYDTGWIDVITPSQLDSALNPINEMNTIQNHRLDNVENRLSDLEDSQFILGLNARVYDGKKVMVELFTDYSTEKQKFDRYGIRFTVKLGESYMDKKVKELEARILALEAVN